MQILTVGMCSNRDLALCTRKGDKQIFGELVCNYPSSIFNRCYRQTGVTREVEDLEQEAIMRKFQRFHHSDTKLPFVYLDATRCD